MLIEPGQYRPDTERHTDSKSPQRAWHLFAFLKFFVFCFLYVTLLLRWRELELGRLEKAADHWRTTSTQMMNADRAWSIPPSHDKTHRPKIATTGMALFCF